MKEPRRLLDVSDDALSRELLGAWQTRTPGRGVLRRTAAVLGVGTTATVAASAAAATGSALKMEAAGGGASAGLAGAAGVAKVAAATPVTALLLAKWCAIGLSGGLVAVGSVYGTSELLDSRAGARAAGSEPRLVDYHGSKRLGPARAAPAVEEPGSDSEESRQGVLGPVGGDKMGLRAQSPAADARPLAGSGREREPEPSSHGARGEHAVSDRGAEPASPHAATPSIAREIALLDRARGALHRGAPEEALRLLNDLEASGPTPTFAPERATLRAEAEQDATRREPGRGEPR